MRISQSKWWTAAIMGVAGVGTLAAVALASSGLGVSGTLYVNSANFDSPVHLNSDKVKFQTKDATDVRVQKLVFAPNSYTGWHHHPGIVIVAVESGAVTLWDSKCNSKTYGPGLPDGAAFSEGGDDPLQATSTDGATTYVTYVAPDNAGFKVEDDPPPCA